MPNKSRSRAYCCVVGCHNYRSCSTDVKFYSFPLRDYKREQREKWIKAVKKEKFQRRMQRNSTKTRIQNETKETKVGKPPIFTESLAHEINPPIQQVFVKSEPESTFLENFNDFDTDIKPDSLQGLHSEHESTFPEVFDDSKLDIKPNIMQITQSEYESTFDSEIDIKPTIVDIPKSEYESIFPVGFDDFKTDIKPNIAHIKKMDNSTQVNFLPNDSNFDIFFCNLNQNGNKCVAETQASFRDYEQINGRKVIVRKVYDWHGKDVRICIE
ncbi:uncharacterized protein LOC123302377 isoform X2 [Chrysoperla carnea]|uniref:uncharacterized protein LOC123302377 isoform X2 n=1 Tax=Chrysoperla carnea TaxID=189513 RepID=UPI001D06F199|nr:uncharacterized protein LOC123302377 isoform X2 [Chrysoperla carnea]